MPCWCPLSTIVGQCCIALQKEGHSDISLIRQVCKNGRTEPGYRESEMRRRVCFGWIQVLILPDADWEGECDKVHCFLVQMFWSRRADRGLIVQLLASTGLLSSTRLGADWKCSHSFGLNFPWIENEARVITELNLTAVFGYSIVVPMKAICMNYSLSFPPGIVSGCFNIYIKKVKPRDTTSHEQDINNLSL